MTEPDETPRPGWLAAAVDTFWALADMTAAPPVSLRLPLQRALPIAIVEMPECTLHHLRQWLSARGGAHLATNEPDRALHGCLVANQGRGWLFLAARDEADEQRYTIAHEVGHFLLDYAQPRVAASRRFGASGLEVLNGQREATLSERARGLGFAYPLQPYRHLLERGPGGPRAAISEAEQRADRVAWELLAPASLVVRAVEMDELERGERELVADQRLRDHHGLPAGPARRYAAFLARERGWSRSTLLRFPTAPGGARSPR